MPKIGRIRFAFIRAEASATSEPSFDLFLRSIEERHLNGKKLIRSQAEELKRRHARGQRKREAAR